MFKGKKYELNNEFQSRLLIIQAFCSAILLLAAIFLPVLILASIATTIFCMPLIRSSSLRNKRNNFLFFAFNSGLLFAFMPLIVLSHIKATSKLHFIKPDMASEAEVQLFAIQTLNHLSIAIASVFSIIFSILLIQERKKFLRKRRRFYYRHNTIKGGYNSVE